MGSLPELRHLDSPPHAPRRSFGAAAGLQVRQPGGRGGRAERGAARAVDRGQTLTPALLEIHSGAGRRRESCSSSVGAASVRRLVRGGGAPQPRAECARTAWARRAAAACLARALAAAALLPLQALQGSVGPWPPGAALLAGLHGAAALSALAGPALLRAAPPPRLLTAAYVLMAVFFAVHAYPKVYILVPAYLAAGACWTPLVLAHDTVLGELAAEGHAQTLPPPVAHGAAPGHQSERRTLLRRLTRASRAARDFGLLLAALLLPLLPSTLRPSSLDIIADFNNTGCLLAPPCNSELYGGNSSLQVENLFGWEDSKKTVNVTEQTWFPIEETEEELEGWREEACGSRGCPGDDIPEGIDGREEMTGIELLPYALSACCFLAALCSLWCWGAEGRGRGPVVAGGPVPWRAALLAVRDPRMRLAGPLAFFIGLEQGFLYAHFLQWYVVCVAGGSQVWRALAGAAVLRALVAATLSMLLAHGRRRLVAGVGLVWHACLLLALGAWRAARADLQLPPVMAAAWAGCGAVWDLLLPTLVDEPNPGGRAALALSLRALGLSLALAARALLCARWALRALFLALPAAALPLLFAPDR